MGLSSAWRWPFFIFLSSHLMLIRTGPLQICNIADGCPAVQLLVKLAKKDKMLRVEDTDALKQHKFQADLKICQEL